MHSLQTRLALAMTTALVAGIAITGSVSAASPTHEVVASTASAQPQLIEMTPNGPIYGQVSSQPQVNPKAMQANSLTSGGCWTITWIVFQNNALGQRVWQYNHQTDWCSDGTKVTGTPAVVRFPSNLAPGWGYAPVGDIQKFWGANHASYRSFSQGQFQFCVPLVGCTTYLPHVDQTVWANGTVTGSAGI